MTNMTGNEVIVNNATGVYQTQPIIQRAHINITFI